MVLLGSKFPRLRRHAAERLYFAGVLVQAKGESRSDSAGNGGAAKGSFWEAGTARVMCDILASAAWDAEDIEVAKGARGRLVLLLDLEPIKTKTVRGGKGKATKFDENASYQALVDNAARGF